MTTHWIPEQLLEPGVGVILDTETTDLDGRIIEISIIDAATGTVLMDQLINPQGAPICAEARTVHHISPDDLATAPTFTQVRPRLEDVVADLERLVRPGANRSGICPSGPGCSGVAVVLPDAFRGVRDGVPVASTRRTPPGPW